MNEYFFYTVQGQTEAPDNTRPVENCQVLGRARGRHLEEAKANLLRENPWISVAGFETSNFLSAQLLTDEQQDDIKCVLAFLKQCPLLPDGSGSQEARCLFEAMQDWKRCCQKGEITVAGVLDELLNKLKNKGFSVSEQEAKEVQRIYEWIVERE